MEGGGRCLDSLEAEDTGTARAGVGAKRIASAGAEKFQAGEIREREGKKTCSVPEASN